MTRPAEISHRSELLMGRLVLGLSLLSPGIGCSSAEGDPAPPAATRDAQRSADIVRLAKEYRDLKLMTPEPVFVNAGLAMLCRGATTGEVDEARLESGPHAHTRIRVFMNDAAADAFRAKTPAYPVGAVVVKEKEGLPFATGKDGDRAVTTDGVGGMVKRPAGYDPRHGDWEYFYFESDEPGEIESGRIASCVNCHAAASETDRVFGRWAGRE